MVTTKQGDVLRALAGYENPPTARQLADRMQRPKSYSATYTYDEVYGQLRRLELKGYVKRVFPGNPPNRWLLSVNGRDYVAEHS